MSGLIGILAYRQGPEPYSIVTPPAALTVYTYIRIATYPAIERCTLGPCHQ